MQSVFEKAGAVFAIMDIPDRTAENTAVSRCSLSTENAASRYSYFSPPDELSQYADRDLYYVDYH